MTRWLPYLLIGPLAAVIALQPHHGAAAHERCVVRGDMIKMLIEQWGETQRGAGLTLEGSIFELWVSDEGGTWTILKSTPDGLACMKAAGLNWEEATPAIPGTDL